MTAGFFEVEFPNELLSGTIDADVNEVGEPAPTYNIDLNDDWEIHVNWQLSGSIFPMINGLWFVSAYMESIGPGDEFKLPPPRPNGIPVNPNLPATYSTVFKIPAGTVQPDANNNDIVYKLVVTVNYQNAQNRWGPIAGFVEIPVLHFYTDIQP
jgi:hypothetical protein